MTFALDRHSQPSQVTLQYVELYNESLYDLLDEHSEELDLRDDANGQATIVGGTRKTITSAREVRWQRLVYRCLQPSVRGGYSSSQKRTAHCQQRDAFSALHSLIVWNSCLRVWEIGRRLSDGPFATGLVV